MTTTPVSLAEVLEAFALEARTDRETLERYLRDYPQFSGELVDLSAEIFAFSHEEDGPLLESDHMRIHSALSQFQSAAVRAARTALERATPERQRVLANSLGLPRQVILGLMERAIVASSIPKPFLRRLAQELNGTTQDLLDYLSQPRQALFRAAKADHKPGGTKQIPFEQMLREAGLSEAEVSRLLADDE